MIDVTKIPESVLKELGRPLVEMTINLLKDPENQKKFEEWHLNKYGHYPTKASYMNESK